MPGFASCLSILCLCSSNSSLIMTSLITASTNGYDGTMMNGLQSLPQWQSAFNHPSNGMLGLLNAIQVVLSLIMIVWLPIGDLSILDLWVLSLSLHTSLMVLVAGRPCSSVQQSCLQRLQYRPHRNP